MGAYRDFRLLLSPDLTQPGNWLVEVDESPLPGAVGPKGSITPTLTPADLGTLRSRNGWPNPATLSQIGQSVWTSVMTESAQLAFESSLQVARQNQEGLRVVVVLQGDANPAPGPAPAVKLSELPVEALYSDTLQFLGTDLTTPISRSLQQRPDSEPKRIELPLRVLVAVAAPNDKPPADTDQEAAVIKEAVQELAGPGGPLQVDFVGNATRTDVAAKLAAKPYHVFHFIGHGGFDTVGDVEAPRAHLCFVRPDGSGRSHPTDADTLSTMLRNTTIQLVVITACSSAAPAPPAANDPLDAGPLGTGAFDGVAQRLVAGVSPVSAAIGMQFDLESVAAVEFSRHFYANLLGPGLALDEVVTIARRALVNALEAGHRAWVTPAVYSRCKDGRVFDINLSEGKIDDATLAQIHDLVRQLAFHRAQIEKIAGKTEEERKALAGFRAESVAELERIDDERANLLGESLRLRGGHAAPGEAVRCGLSLRCLQAGSVASIQCTVAYPEDALDFAGADAGADAAAPPLTAPAPGTIQIGVLDPAAGQQWQPREYELAALRFTVRPEASAPLLDVRVTGPQVTRDGQQATFRPIDGIVVVDE